MTTVKIILPNVIKVQDHRSFDLLEDVINSITDSKIKVRQVPREVWEPYNCQMNFGVVYQDIYPSIETMKQLVETCMGNSE